MAISTAIRSTALSAVMLAIVLSFGTGMAQAATPAATAQSSSAATRGGTLTSGTAVTATVATAGQTVAYSWAAVKGKHVTFDISGTSWKNTTGGSPAGYLAIYDAAGSAVDLRYMTTIATSLEITPATTGTFTAVVSAAGGSTGSLTFTYATDITGTSPAGQLMTAPINYRGQHAVYTWSATQGRTVTFTIPSWTWIDNSNATTLPGAGYVALYDASGHFLGGLYVADGQTSHTITVTPAASGTFTVLVNGYPGSTGSATFTHN